MNKRQVLERLSRREPLFTAFPPHGNTAPRRILGVEVEFGSMSLANDDSPPADLKSACFPQVLSTGGRAYVDVGNHLEVCTPECDNLIDLVAQYQAMQFTARHLQVPPLRLYCHNRDFQKPAHTFGFHENYFTSAPRDEWPRITPFLVARTIIAGTGSQQENGYSILQRAPFLVNGVRDYPYKTIITDRSESLSSVAGWDRMHLLCGDSPMCPMTLFLSMGFTSLVIEMLELGALPDVEYEHFNEAADDVQAISKLTSNWSLHGIIRGPKGAVDLLSLYLSKAKSLFEGRDLVTDILIAALEDTIEKLGGNPEALFGRLDWVTKLYLLNQFKELTGASPEALMSQDLEYHLLDPNEGLHLLARRHGYIERVVSQLLMKEAMGNPPRNTRAFARGTIARLVRQEHPSIWQPHPNYSCWETIAYQHSKNASATVRCPIGNPFLTYEHALHDLIDKFRRLSLQN